MTQAAYPKMIDLTLDYWILYNWILNYGFK